MARSIVRWLPAIGSLILTGSLVAACGGGSETTASGGTGATAGTGGTGAGAGTAGDGGAGAGIPVGCDPPCMDPQVCSVASECIDPGTCLEDGDCAGGTVCDKATSTCVPGGRCGGQEAKAEAVAPNLLIVLDRSCSMTKLADGVSTKWEIAVKAIQTLTTNFDGKIRFGLSLFPDLETPDCKQGAIAVPVGPGNEMTISDLLGASLAKADPNYPDGPCVTNIDTAMEQAAAEPAFVDPERDSYALLITDGKQAGCSAAGGDAGTTMIIKDMHDMQGVSTFVLGFGTGIDPVQMNIFADAGGVPAGDPTKYYDAADQASLDAALDVIANKTLGCVFSLDQEPPNPDEIFVFFDNKDKILEDPTHAMGWDYDPATNQVTFYGATCDKLKAGEVTDVDIVFGCDEPTPT